MVFIGMLNSSSAASASELKDARTIEAAEQVRALRPFSLRLVDGAISSLSQGWSGMNQVERDIFLQLYDPSGTAGIDEQYVVKVLENYRKIRATLDSDIEVVYVGQGGACKEQRLYYTDLVRLYVCPYFFVENNEGRKARTLIHEMAHISLLVVDRPYYVPTSEQYAELTPNGSWITEVPLVGCVAREVLRGDTLYHPDAYAHFALLNAGYTYICLDV